LKCLSKLNAEMDVRRRRRALSADEAVRLLVSTRKSDRVFRGLSGHDRFFLYAFAFQSGLRAGELASVRPASFQLDADTPFVQLEARRSKRRRLDEQPLPRELADLLRPWLALRPADGPVWPGTWYKRAGAMIGRDLEDARQAWLAEAGPNVKERERRERTDYLTAVDGDGRVFDFHATRHSYVTLLAQSGVHPKAAQDLARHSTSGSR
jgi:integrase